MAKAGLEVAILERGAKPGSKNVMGGILYNHYLEEIVGEDWKQAPLERPIIEERRWLMTPRPRSASTTRTCATASTRTPTRCCARGSTRGLRSRPRRPGRW